MSRRGALAENFGRLRDADTLVSVFFESSAMRRSSTAVRRGLLGCALALLLATLSAPSSGRPLSYPAEPLGGSPSARQSDMGAAFSSVLGAARAHADAADANLPFSAEPGVVLSAPLRAALTQLGQAFHGLARRRFHVTSGSRTPTEQARAMFDKLASGGSLTGLYRDYEAAQQLERAYQRARRSGPAACVAAMTRVLASQMARGVYISRHLHAGAVDVRSRDMSPRERRLFRQAVARQRGASVLEEGRPPHFHVEFRLLER